MTGWKKPIHEDVFPIRNGDFPTCHVGLLEGKWVGRMKWYPNILLMSKRTSFLYQISTTFETMNIAHGSWGNLVLLPPTHAVWHSSSVIWHFVETIHRFKPPRLTQIQAHNNDHPTPKENTNHIPIISHLSDELKQPTSTWKGRKPNKSCKRCSLTRCFSSAGGRVKNDLFFSPSNCGCF